MLRATFIATALLGSALCGGARADEACRTVDELQAKMAADAPAVSVRVLAEVDNNTIRQTITRAGAEGGQATDSFVVIDQPGAPMVLLVWFQNGCYVAHRMMARHELDTLLSGQGAAR